MQNENRLTDLRDSINHNNICVIGIQEEDREKEAETLFEEIIAENILKLGKRTDIQIHEAQRTHNKIIQSRSTPRHIVIKWENVVIREEFKKKKNKTKEDSSTK